MVFDKLKIQDHEKLSFLHHDFTPVYLIVFKIYFNKKNPNLFFLIFFNN